jgi:hypothetical protein
MFKESVGYSNKAQSARQLCLEVMKVVRVIGKSRTSFHRPYNEKHKMVVGKRLESQPCRLTNQKAPRVRSEDRPCSLYMISE